MRKNFSNTLIFNGILTSYEKYQKMKADAAGKQKEEAAEAKPVPSEPPAARPAVPDSGEEKEKEKQRAVLKAEIARKEAEREFIMSQVHKITNEIKMLRDRLDGMTGE